MQTDQQPAGGLGGLSFAETTGRTTAPARQAPPVDMERLLDFANGDTGNLRELVELYIQQTGKQVSQLITAAGAGAADEVKRLAHSCSGASSTCGMTGMIGLLKELERQGNEGLQANALQLAQEARQEFERIEKFLVEYLNAPAAPPQLVKT